MSGTTFRWPFICLFCRIFYSTSRASPSNRWSSSLFWNKKVYLREVEWVAPHRGATQCWAGLQPQLCLMPQAMPFLWHHWGAMKNRENPRPTEILFRTGPVSSAAWGGQKSGPLSLVAKVTRIPRPQADLGVKHLSSTTPLKVSLKRLQRNTSDF